MREFDVRKQAGAVLVVGMIMLLLLTLMVSAAFTLSGTNLKAVGNMQVRDQLIAAANVALEKKISSPLSEFTSAEDLDVDIDDDGKIDFVVNVEPSCVSDSPASYATGSGLSGEELKGEGQPLADSLVPGSGFNVILDLKAEVKDSASGAEVTVRTGVRILVNKESLGDVCPESIWL